MKEAILPRDLICNLEATSISKHQLYHNLICWLAYFQFHAAASNTVNLQKHTHMVVDRKHLRLHTYCDDYLIHPL